MKKTAIIIGAGPAGLTAAYELLEKTNIKPIVLEMSNQVGGLSKTLNYKGNYIDIGGHRFFSKSDKIMKWWQNILPIEPLKEENRKDKEKLLIRKRLSRIYFSQKFFDYPITLSKKTIINLGFWRMLKITMSFLWIRIFPIKKEKNLEDFFINRFGKELYNTFFRNYTKKVWGRPCRKIKPEWGSQRIKKISMLKICQHALKKFLQEKKEEGDIKQKKTETSLIDKFLYPKFGPGQLWEKVAKIIKTKGGEIRNNQKVVGVYESKKGKQIAKVKIKNFADNRERILKADYFFSTMAIQDLIKAWQRNVPQEVRKVAQGLKYRSLLVVGLLLKKMKTKLPDNWIYIQEPNVKLGRLQIFNNWSPYLVKNPQTVWLGLEYFCNQDDDLWKKPQKAMKKLAIKELVKIGLIREKEVQDAVVIKTAKAYPAYFDSYERLDTIKDFVNQFENLFLIGRNGMHHYNNQDHSMLTAIEAVKNIIKNTPRKKKNIWSINSENEYHEKKKLKID